VQSPSGSSAEHLKGLCQNLGPLLVSSGELGDHGDDHGEFFGTAGHFGATPGATALRACRKCFAKDSPVNGTSAPVFRLMSDS